MLKTSISTEANWEAVTRPSLHSKVCSECADTLLGQMLYDFVRECNHELPGTCIAFRFRGKCFCSSMLITPLQPHCRGDQIVGGVSSASTNIPCNMPSPSIMYAARLDTLRTKTCSVRVRGQLRYGVGLEPDNMGQLSNSHSTSILGAASYVEDRLLLNATSPDEWGSAFATYKVHMRTTLFRVWDPRLWAISHEG